MSEPRFLPISDPCLIVLSAVVGLLLGGCQHITPGEKPVSQSHLMGKTKADLLACAGAPISDTRHDQQNVLLYHKDAPTFDQSFFGSKASVSGIHHECTAVLTIQNDRVVAVEYRPFPPSVAADDHCEEIFRSCIS
ncbi:MAG: hypothetical protein ACKOCD_04320 [Nitrospiraceae bacterium]